MSPTSRTAALAGGIGRHGAVLLTALRLRVGPRHLWPQVARIIAEVEPPFVFLENVAHHLRVSFTPSPRPT